MLKHVRRAALGLTTAALVTSGAVVAPTSAATPEAGSTADWLATQLTDGILVNQTEFGEYRNYGGTLDVFFTLRALRVRPADQEHILASLEPEMDAYTTYLGTVFAGPTAKLLTAVQTAGIAPESYGDGSLLGDLAARVKRRGPQKGRAIDGPGEDYSNTIGQAWVVRALAGANHRLLGSTSEFLLKQQCGAGFFREGMSSRDFTCDSGRRQGLSRPSVDATAYALLALIDARRAGVRGLRDDIGDAVAWLRSRQAPSGSFTGNGVANSNTTGLAATALARSGWRGAAGTAAEWVSRLQVTNANAEGTALTGEIGAIAYDQSAFDEAAADGIGDADRIQWQMAAVQAGAALDALLPGEVFAVSAPVRASKRQLVTVEGRGLEPGERFTVRRAGRRVASGWVGRTGVVSVQVRMPDRVGDVTVKVVGAAPDRVGSATVRVR